MSTDLTLMLLEGEQKKKYAVNLIRRKKERGTGTMPMEFMKEFIGQVCQINMFDGMGEVAMLTDVEGSWLKVENNGKTALINGELVRSIFAMPEKYQEKYQEKARRKS
ncbi:MAG: hypothetical protein NC131_20840 [Roseburia sp.]|nr:hypothetical protein [Roseburia sp.]